MSQDQTVRMDPAIAANYRKLMPMAWEAMGQGYTPYMGQRLAGFTPYEQAAMQGIGAMANAGLPQGFLMGQGASARALQGMYGVPQNAFAQMQGLGSLAGNVAMWPDQGVAQQYMNPYTQNVTNIGIREAERAGQRQMQDLRSQAGGAFGGTRHALLEGQIAQGTREQIADLTQQGQMQAYQAGMAQFNADRAARAAGLNQQAQLYGQGYSTLMGGLGQQQQMADRLAQGAAMGQGMQYEMLDRLQQAGINQRDLQQRALSMGYEDFMRQRYFPQEQMAWMSGLINNMPSTGYWQGQIPNTYGQNATTDMLSTGIAGAGVYQQRQAQR